MISLATNQNLRVAYVSKAHHKIYHRSVFCNPDNIHIICNVDNNENLIYEIDQKLEHFVNEVNTLWNAGPLPGVGRPYVCEKLYPTAQRTANTMNTYYNRSAET